MSGRFIHIKFWCLLVLAVTGWIVPAGHSRAATVVAGAQASSSAAAAQPENLASTPLLVSISTDAAGGDAGAMRFVQDMADRAIGFLGNEKMAMDQKKASFRKLLQDSFDMKTIGRFSLGRYWRVSTPEQRKEYQRLFEKMIVSVYSDRFSEYKGQKVEVRSSRKDSENDTLVTSFIVPQEGPEIQVDWRIRHKDGQYKVVDVIVEGVSMSVTQRSDFAAVIQRGGGNVQVLITHLQSL